MSTLVECVPNFSEGRNKAVVDAIVEAMKVPGVFLLDREMDSDHNRCVITLVGDGEAVAEAAVRGVGPVSLASWNRAVNKRMLGGVIRL